MTDNPTQRGTYGTHGAHEYVIPGDQQRQQAPAGACGAVFDRIPQVARDARSQAPCIRPQGHTGGHENDRGMSWGARATTTPYTRSTTKRSIPMTREQLKARMRQLEDRYINPAPRRSTMSTTSVAPSGPLARAQRAVNLTGQAPYGGFLPSQAANGMRDLANAGAELLQLAQTSWGDGVSHRQERAHLARLVANFRSLAVPGAPAPTFRHEDVTEMTRAVRALLEPLTEQQRRNNHMKRRFAAAAAAQPPTAPSLHPWDRGGTAA
ncbi:hypothetical protein [Streptomyces sp. PAM3C]|uniref:hypothetical protein n=1 Tax=Streptomyces sp. PAM3C TaxID=2847300 RepID=UPI001C1E2D6F|nr:hypothetical protein [Streptomyces sp. PAM3C]MBU5944909.1 hypothetical protein [Streptomyces sp. PAM3C]